MLWYAALSHEGLVTVTYSMISLLLGLLRLDRHGIFLLVVCFLAASRTDATGGTADSTAYAHTANETDAFLQKLADARVLSGTVLVQKDGQFVYSNAFGWASEVSYSLGQAPSAFLRRIPLHMAFLSHVTDLDPRLPVMTYSDVGDRRHGCSLSERSNEDSWKEYRPPGQAFVAPLKAKVESLLWQLDRAF